MMSPNGNLAATVGALLLLGTAVLLFGAAVLLVQSLIVRRQARARIALVCLLVVLVGYVSVMLIFSFASHETVLAHGQEKYFCEIDCHLAYSITSIQKAGTFGEGPIQKKAQGQFTIVTVRTRFDETTISNTRGNSPLFPNPRAVTLMDARGNAYAVVGQMGQPLTTALRPGEAYTTGLAFDLPAEATPSSLLINEDDFITRLVIGHENSVLHHKTRFQL